MSHGLKIDLPSDPARAVLELLAIKPELTEHASALHMLAKVAWRGHWPGDFFHHIANLVQRLPWLKAEIDRWIDPAVFQPLNADMNWDFPVQRQQWAHEWTEVYREYPSSILPMEGLLLLSCLVWGRWQNDGAHHLLRRVLSATDAGLVSQDRNTTGERLRHPLKDLFLSLDGAQTLESFAESLEKLLPQVDALYPMVGKFLREAYLPLARRAPRLWTRFPGFESPQLGADKEPAPPPGLPESPTAILASQPESGSSELRPFASSDLASEMLAFASELAPDTENLSAVAAGWRGEETTRFYETVGRLASKLKWLGPLLNPWISPEATANLRKATNSTLGMGYAFKKIERFRKENSIAKPATRLYTQFPFFSSSKNPRRWGIDHLRGLLLLGRMEWGTDTNTDAQSALENLVFYLMRRLVRNSEFETYALELSINRIGQPGSPAELATTLHRLLPSIGTFDFEAAKLLEKAYLPLIDRSQEFTWTAEPLASIDFSSPPAITTPITPDPVPLTNTPAESASGNTLARGPRTSGSRSNTRRLTIGKARINLPTRETQLPGESVEESSPGTTAIRRSSVSVAPLPLKEELVWVRQRVWGTNELLMREHIESLSDPEAHALARALEAQVASDIESDRFSEAWMGVLTGLTLVTGRVAGRWAQVELCRDAAMSTPYSGTPQLFLRDGIFRIPVERPDRAFQPEESMQSMLEKTRPSLDLPLPPTLSTRLRELADRDSGRGFDRDQGEIKKGMERFVASLDRHVGTGVNLSRVRRVARARIREASGDTAATMILCGDDFGASTAPLYYSCLETSELQKSFRMATWPLFGDHPTVNERTGYERVGSQLLVTNETVHALARSPGAAMHASDKHKSVDSMVVPDHNALINHTVCMLIGVAGHRPTNALFKLTRFDFDLAVKGAIFYDKQCDAAHLFRYAPIADVLADQMESLYRHLRGLLVHPQLPADTAAQVRRAISGEGPLFFHLLADFLPRLLEIKTWAPTLPDNWQVLPMNWGRTWIASRGRDAGIDADHLAIALGHLEAAGYPFSKDSPLEPAGLSGAISAQLGQLARSSGWVVRKGLPHCSTDAEAIRELGPLREWKRERTILAEQTREYVVEQRQTSRAAFRKHREQGESTAYKALTSVVQGLIPGFEDLKELRKQKRENPAPQQNYSLISLTDDGLKRIQLAIDAETQNSQIQRIASQNALYRYVKAINALLGWQWPSPAPWLAPSTLEPTPFFPGLLRATAQTHVMREAFSKIPIRAPSDTKFTELEWATGITAIALCIFGFIDDADNLTQILSGRQSGIRSRTFADLLLVEIGEEKRVIGLRGLAATSLARLAKRFPDDALPKEDILGRVIAMQLPEPLVGKEKHVVARLCATVRMSNIIELSGLARLALDPNIGSTSMNVERQRQLLEEGYGSSEVADVADPSLLREERQILTKRCGPAIAKIQYKHLRETLHIGEGPKYFPLTRTTLSQANINAFRNPLVRELTAFLANEDLSQIVACIAAFACHLTMHGTPEKVNPAWSTVHKYITSFGADLIGVSADLDFLQLDPEEYIDVYQDIIDRKSGAGQRSTTARELVEFHKYLQVHNGFDVVDFSELEAPHSISAGQVDAEIIQPQEYLEGLRRIADLASLMSSDQSLEADQRRLFRQVHIFALLLRGSGARMNELAGLRFKDIVATPDATVLLIRPSGYRRLKTKAGRRVSDISSRLSRRQRQVIVDWIAAERARLDSAWKPTLPLLGKFDTPKERVPSVVLRDLTLGAMDDVVGYRTKIHRGRHLVIGEDLLNILLSHEDWQALRRARTHAGRRVVRPTWSLILLPRNLRQLSTSFGHRRPSTTIANYFHMPWVAASRAHDALDHFTNRHSGAVVLGASVANIDKLVQRARSSRPGLQRGHLWTGVWLDHLLGKASATPGRAVQITEQRSTVKPASILPARRIERVLRDVQRGVESHQLHLSHGLTEMQFKALQRLAGEVEHRTGFRIWPRSDSAKGSLRVARTFQGAISLETLLDPIDRGQADPDRQLVISVAQAYVTWAIKGRRDAFQWPSREAKRLEELLAKLGISGNQVNCTPVKERDGFVEIRVARAVGATRYLNHQIAWLLVVAYIAAHADLSIEVD